MPYTNILKTTEVVRQGFEETIKNRTIIPLLKNFINNFINHFFGLQYELEYENSFVYKFFSNVSRIKSYNSSSCLSPSIAKIFTKLKSFSYHIQSCSNINLFDKCKKYSENPQFRVIKGKYKYCKNFPKNKLQSQGIFLDWGNFSPTEKM